ncbi:hypothetical protein L484_013585 [Morus notabilis]|uniref:Uncharacterized protein n=1 Tax=Morus notabilis TaxID=981085 RepID=W9QF36_9ROSA|nr:uncharacterized protein LOC21396756 [Morus notabilis]EXB31953.1 hypothetical protein L484_013585 [Morus notabilis]
MGRPCFLTTALLVSFFMFLLFSHGFGRTLKSTIQDEDSSVEVKEVGGNSREIIEVMDYEGPHPNKNERGINVSPPPT